MSQETPIQRLKVGGQFYVFMPFDEYQALAKSASALSKALTEPENVHEFTSTVPVVKNGDGNLRAWRKHRGLTLDELAAMAGTRKSFLSQIENGNMLGRATLWRTLAEALDVSIEDILPLN